MFKIGQVLQGRLSKYTLTKELYRSADDGRVFLASNSMGGKYIVKSIPKHWRLQNEAKILKRYQDGVPHIRPLLDEISEPSEPSSIVLEYMESDLLTESNTDRLLRPEIKRVARATLEVLKVLHADGLVHTDVKLNNIFVNHGKTGQQQRFSDFKLGDFGGVVAETSEFARDGHLIGAVINRSPETMLGIPWGTPTDIWSFGTCILSLLHGGDYHLFNPGIEGFRPEDDDYEYTALKRMYKFFGPFPASFKDFETANPDIMTILDHFNNSGPPEKPFHRVTTKEIPPADNKFILKIMKLDPRDRPTATALLEDDWFTETSEDTRIPLQ